MGTHHWAHVGWVPLAPHPTLRPPHALDVLHVRRAGGRSLFRLQPVEMFLVDARRPEVSGLDIPAQLAPREFQALRIRPGQRVGHVRLSGLRHVAHWHGRHLALLGRRSLAVAE